MLFVKGNCVVITVLVQPFTIQNRLELISRSFKICCDHTYQNKYVVIIFYLQFSVSNRSLMQHIL